MGKAPLEMMDRDKAFIPDLQVGFITDIVIPLFTDLAILFPVTKSLVTILEYNKELWEASKDVFTKYAEKGIKGIKVLLVPKFEQEVFEIYHGHNYECKNLTCNP